VVVGLLLLVTLLFVVAFVLETSRETAPTPEPLTELTAESYLDIVNPLLAEGDAADGAQLVEQYGCIACHRLAGNAHIAPLFEGIADRAGTRRPPLSAEAYIYESITHPAAFVVESYAAAMPQDFAIRLTPDELGDIIAYLLTPDAR
jgi:cytochrome c oxidase subunit 2